jgi:uncharacterized protein YydD (DUF2326 family)
MRLSRLYSNRAGVFAPIKFQPGLNVVLAEIRLPGNSSKDTHNLGKTTLGRVVDFCLLKGADQTFFLTKRKDIFGDLTLYLEVELLDGGFVTIRREVQTASKIWLKLHTEGDCDFSSLADSEWDRARVPIEKAVVMLDGILNLSDLTPWHYRKLVGYLLRSQNDYQDVFQLSKFKGKESDWKPFLAQILGFDAQRIVDQYARETDLDAAKAEESIVERELGGSVEELSKIEGLLLLRQTEIDQRSEQLERFDFERVDADKVTALVGSIDSAIAQANGEHYRLSHNLNRVQAVLEDDKILFDSEEVASLLAEAKVLFAGQLKKDFDQLLEFNRAITEERRTYLLQELAETEVALADLHDELVAMNAERSRALSFLADAKALAKYKSATDELVNLRAEVVSLERQQGSLRRLQELRTRLRTLRDDVSQITEQVVEDVEATNTDRESLFSMIRLRFSSIVGQVIDRKALLIVKTNNNGHLDFKAEILDERDQSSDADAGNTYRKLLCIALDLAILGSRLDGRCSRFVFHDAVFESLDDRKKENLLAAMREYAGIGVQQVITLIEADLPRNRDAGSVFSDSEIVLRLHDAGEDGRLFKMPAW